MFEIEDWGTIDWGHCLEALRYYFGDILIPPSWAVYSVIVFLCIWTYKKNRNPLVIVQYNFPVRVIFGILYLNIWGTN